MRHTLTTLLLTALSAVVVLATPATAQLIGDRVRIDTIRVGVVADRDGEGVTLQSGNYYRFDEMKTLEVLAGTKSSAGAGFKVGALAGLGIGFVIGLIASEDGGFYRYDGGESDDSSIGKRILAGAGVGFLGAIVGGGIGGILGAMARTEDWRPIVILSPDDTTVRLGARWSPGR